MELSEKKQYEKLVTDFFIEECNKRYNLSYRTAIVEDESSKVDTIMSSDQPGESDIDLQLVRAEGEILDDLGKLHTIVEKLGITPVTNHPDKTVKDDVARAIMIKAQRYGEEVSRKLVLIVWREWSCEINEEYALQRWKNLPTAFKGIYYICMPDMHSNDPAHKHEGQIIAVRAINDDAGRVLDFAI